MPISSGFYNVKGVVATLERELNQYEYRGDARFKVDARPALSWQGGAYRENPGEYEVTVSHTGMPGESWTGIISGGPNQTIKVRSGAGWRMYNGDLLPIGDQGITVPQGMEGVAPYNTGVTSFAQRLVGAFGERSATPQERRQYEPTINSLLHKIDNPGAIEGGVWRTPAGGQTGVIPASGVWISEQTSPIELEYLSRRFNIAVQPNVDISRAISGIEAQVRQYGIQAARGARYATGALREPVAAGWSLLHGGAVDISERVFIPPAAYGSLYRGPQGQVQAARLAEDPTKAYYGRRNIDIPAIITEGGISPLPQQFLRQASTTLGNEAPYTGMPTTNLTWVNKAPWQSGQINFQLPENIRRYVTGQGGQLGYAATGREAMPLVGLESPAQLLSAGLRLNADLIGKRQLPGQFVGVGTWSPGTPGARPQQLGWTTGQGQESITGYELELPAAWGQTKMQLQQLAPVFRQLEGVGFSKFSFGEVETPTLNIQKLIADPFAIKMASTKGFPGMPLMGVSQQIRGGNVPGMAYDILQEAKSPDALMLNALQALPKEQILPFIRTVLPGARRALAGYQGGTGLAEIAKAAGYQTGEHLLSDIATRALSLPTPFEDLSRKQLALNQYLLSTYGIGRVQGQVPIQQFTPQSVRAFRRQFLTSMMAPTEFDEFGQPTEAGRGMTALQAKAVYNQVIRPNLQRTGQDTYTLFSRGQEEFIRTGGLMTANVEYPGIGSDEGMISSFLGGIGEKGLQSWFESNYDRLFTEKPVRAALQTLGKSWFAGNRGSPDLATSVIVGGERGLNPTDILSRTEALQQPGDQPIDRLRALTSVVREMSGWKGEVDPVLWMARSKVAVPLGDVAEQLMSKRILMGEGTEPPSTEDVTRNIQRLLGWTVGPQGFLQSESVGAENPVMKYQLGEWLKPFVTTKQAFQEKGGLYARYAVGSMLKENEIFMSKNAVIRDYLLKGGSVASLEAFTRGGKGGAAAEFRSYVKAIEHAPGVFMRSPAPQIGTELGGPGSYMLAQLITPFSRRGKKIHEQMLHAGVVPADLTVSQVAGALLGDADADPGMLFSAVVRNMNRAGNFVFHRFMEGSTRREQNEYMNVVAQRYSLEEQVRAEKAIFGSAYEAEMPLGKQIRSYVSNALGLLSGKRAMLGADNLQEVMENFRLNKTELMGSEYNALIRKVTASGTVLGIPEPLTTAMRDVGIAPYQAAIDIRGKETQFEAMVSSGWVTARGGDMNVPGRLEYGYYMGNEARVSTWSPTGGDINRLLGATATEAAMSGRTTPVGVASMFMDVPERPAGMSMENWQRTLEARRMAITGRLAGPMQHRPGEGRPAWEGRVGGVISSLFAEGQFGARSVGGMSILARMAEYGEADPERAAALRRLTSMNPMNLGSMGIMNWEQLVEATTPQRTIFEAMNRKRLLSRGERGKSQLPLSPVALVQTIEAVRGVDNLRTAAMSQVLQFANLAGISVEGGTITRDPATGAPVTIQTAEDIAAMKAAWAQPVLHAAPVPQQPSGVGGATGEGDVGGTGGGPPGVTLPPPPETPNFQGPRGAPAPGRRPSNWVPRPGVPYSPQMAMAGAAAQPAGTAPARRWAGTGGPNLTQGRAAEAYMGLQELIEMNFGRLSGPGGTLVSPISGGLERMLQNVPGYLAQAFPAGAAEIRAVGAARGPTAAYERAFELAKQAGIDLVPLLKGVPELQTFRMDVAEMAKRGQQVGRNLSVLPAGLEAQYAMTSPLGAMFYGGGQAEAARTALIQGGNAGLARDIESMQQLGAVMGAPGRLGKRPDITPEGLENWARTIERVNAGIKSSTELHKTYGDSLATMNGVMKATLEQDWVQAGKGDVYAKGMGAIAKAQGFRGRVEEQARRLMGITVGPEGMTPEQISQLARQVPSASADLARYNLAGQRIMTTEEDILAGPAVAARGGGRGGGGGREGDMGMLARRMLGGFGLMYMRSIWGIATQGLQYGYGEYNQQMAQMEGGLGGYLGGAIPSVTPEMQLSRIAGTTGGVGWAGLRTLQAQAYQRPGVPGLAGLATAMLGAGGGLATMGLWMGAPIAAPILAGAALVGGGLYAAGSIYGAAQETDRNAQYIAAQVAAGRGVLGAGGQFVATQGIPGTDWNAIGYRAAFAKQSPIVRILEGMRQFQARGGGDVREYLRSQGIKPEEYSRYITMYGQTQSAQYPNIPIEGLAGALGMQTAYNLQLTEGAAGTRALLGTMLAQNIPIEQTALAYAQAGGGYAGQQRAMAGTYIQKWLEQQQATGRGLTGFDLQNYQQAAERFSRIQGMYTPRPVSEMVYRYNEGIREERLAAQQVPTWEAIGAGATWGTASGRQIYRGNVYEAAGAFQRPTSPAYTGRLETVDKMAQQILQLLSPESTSNREFKIIAQRVDIETQRAELGMGFQQLTPEMINRYRGQSAANLGLLALSDMGRQVETQSYQQYVQAMTRIGIAPGPMAAGMTQGQMRLGGQQANFGMGIESQLLMGGATPARGQQFAQAFARMTPQQYAMYQGVFSMEPLAMGAWAQQMGGGMMNFPAALTGWGGGQIDTRSMFMTDIGANGRMTGLPWGTTSLAFPNQVAALGRGAAAAGISSAATALSIWGNVSRPNLSQNLIQSMISGGAYGGAQYQLNLQNQYQTTMDALQMQQFQLTQRYQPQFWALEDQSRNVSRGYQTWQLGMQERQLGIQSEQFMSNWGINRRQATLQRGWSQQDWAYQDTVRGMQWQWRQEDYQEQARFLTGRERRLAERQMGRETIMFGMEGEQIDKQRERQKELWKLEDQRFALQLKQHQQSVELQKESIERLRQYYKEQWALEDKQRDLSRAQWKEQQALQLKSIETTQAYNAEQRKINQTMLEFSQWAEKLTAGKSLFNPDTMNQLAEAIVSVDNAFKGLLQTGGVTGQASTGRQHGGLVVAGRRYRVGEAGEETYVPYATGMVYPSNPWNSQMQVSSPEGSRGGKQMLLIINLGNETLARKVINMVDQEVGV